MTPCPHCGRDVVKARVDQDAWRILDAEPTRDGEWATWTVREGLNWIVKARQTEYHDRLVGRHLRQLHDCAPLGQQLELSA